MAMANSSGLCINDVLSNDELTEIFLRIDPMDLFRCKLVCKRWLSCTGNEVDFVAPFILRRSKEPPPLCVDKGDDHETIHLKWSRSERVLLNPTWYCLSFRKFSSILCRNHRLRCCSDYFDKDLSSTIVGSSNGLLLVSGFGSSPGRYCICNPITKHWLELPPFTHYHCSRGFYLEVGFITDPFYELCDDDSSASVMKQISAKVVRLDFTRYNGKEKDGQVDVEVFSSDSGYWTSFRMKLPDYFTDKIDSYLWGRAIPYEGSLYWLIANRAQETEFLVYDTNKNEFLMDIVGVLPSSTATYRFKGIGVCQNSLWVAEVLWGRLRVYALAGSVWDLMHDVDIINDMECSSNSVKGCYSYILQRGIDSFTMHPTNIMMGYISVLNIMIECDFDSRTMTPIIDVVGPDGESPSCAYFAVLLPICLPIWPTPLPLLPNAA